MAGARERWDNANWLPTFSASCTRELIHGAFPAVMEDHDIRRVIRNYAAAARRVRDGDVDGVEISCQAATLIEQFWSPLTNFRSDNYGGTLQNRMRLGLEILAAIRVAVGEEYAVGIRMPGDQLAKGGLSQDDCVKIARTYTASGLIDFISVVGGQASAYKDEARIWPTMWVPSAAYLDLAKAVKEAVDIPILHATRITDAATAVHAVTEGHLDMVGMTRAFLADPHHVNKVCEGREAEIRPCVGAGYCVDRVISGKDALCVHNVATGRELEIPQVILKSSGPSRKIVVAGGGPAGLEASRVCALRGHNVVLFEAAGELGGQILLAGKATWRRGLLGIASWLAAEMERLGVDVRFNTLADQEIVEGEDPDAVVVAAGGLPDVGKFAGNELALSTWDILSGAATPGADIVLFDENGSHGGLSCAEVCGAAGANINVATPDRALGRELGGTNLGAHMSELYRYGIKIHPDSRVIEVRKSANKLQVSVQNTYNGAIVEMEADQVIGDYATSANDELYHQLKPHSRNLGETDLEALAANAPQKCDINPAGRYFLHRIGDAWTSRNIHAAMLDAMRICKDL